MFRYWILVLFFLAMPVAGQAKPNCSSWLQWSSGKRRAKEMWSDVFAKTPISGINPAC